MKKNFVIFESPGAFVHETTELPIESWDIEKAQRLAHTITERHGATPFAFYFTTRARSESELDSKVVKTSGRYFLGGEIKTLAQVKAENDPSNAILISNMECNKWHSILVNNNSYKSHHPLNTNDVVLDWKPRKKKAA